MADAAAELDEGGVTRTLKDLFAGAAGGIAQVLLGAFGAQSCFYFHNYPLSTAPHDVTCTHKWGISTQLQR